jgi:cytochrome P450
MITYDPYMPEIKQAPLEVYAQMREESPVHYVERFDAWALTRFEHIWQVSADREHFTNVNGTTDITFLERKPAVMTSLASTDPPLHDEIRTQLFPFFGPAAARRLEPSVRSWATECIDRHAGSGRIDAVQDLAKHVAVRVSCSVSGFPIEDADYLVDLVSRFFARDPKTEGMSEGGQKARLEMFSYLEDVALKRDGDTPPRYAKDVFNRWRDEPDGFEARWVGQHLTLLLLGATDTFPKVFASALLRLWQHPEQRRLLRDDPALIPEALNEVLRYDMPTQWLGRTVRKDVELGGKALRAGQPVLLIYPSANRDALEFDEPDVFDVQRNAPRILSFGHGVHRCLGAFMARLEGRVLLEEVLRRFPDYQVLESETVRPATEFVQGYSDFPIALH